MSLLARFRGVARSIRAIGIRNTLQYNFDRTRFYLGRPTTGILQFKPKGTQYPIALRGGRSSDIAVFRQVFMEDAYRPLRTASAVRCILDLGANIGLASIYFLNHFPDARVLAVEPDPENYTLCARNLAPYGDRARVLLGAVWTRVAKLALSRAGDGRSWAITVTEPEEEPATVQCWDIPTLLSTARFEEVDLLKIDIEGSERVLFEHSCEGWLPSVRNLSIELHGKSCEESFFDAMSDFDYEIDHSGELLVCRNIRSRR